MATNHYSNAFVFHLASLAEQTYESSGFYYMHSIILASLWIITTDSAAASALNEPCNEPFDMPCLSYADLMLNVIVDVCQEPEFWRSLASTFHMIAPGLRVVSIGTAHRVLDVFERSFVIQNQLAPLFLEGFTAILQVRQAPTNGFLVALYERRKFFKRIAPEVRTFKRPLASVLFYLVAANRFTKSLQRKQVQSDELAEGLAGLNPDDIFAEKVTILKYPHVFSVEMANKWLEWADLFCSRVFSAELATWKPFQRESQRVA
jgi:hypothetical protein